MVSFSEAVARYFGQYATFTGRATRAEFWWVQLFNFIISFVLYLLPLIYLLASGMSFLSLATGTPMLLKVSQVILSLYGLATLIPSLALTVRRLHDISRSGYWLIAFYVLYFAAFIIIISGAMMTALLPGRNMFAMVFIAAIMLIGLCIWWLVWMCTPSDPDNEYGPDPEAEEYWQ